MELITIWHIFVTEMSIHFSIASFIAFGPINNQGISEVKIFGITKLSEKIILPPFNVLSFTVFGKYILQNNRTNEEKQVS